MTWRPDPEPIAEQELDREELAAYYDARGWPWRREDDEEDHHYDTPDEEPEDD